MRAIAADRIGRFAGDGRCEFMGDFADHFPAQVICHVLGVPDEDHESFASWGDAITHALSLELSQYIDEATRGFEELNAYLDELIGSRHAEPRDDLVSELIAASEEGDSLSPMELRALLGGLLFAGYDTTRNQLGLALNLLCEQPDQWRLLGDRPELAERAVEEVLRTVGTVSVTPRMTNEVVELDGWRIPAGTIVSLSLAAANHDPAAYENPPRVRHNRRAGAAVHLRRRPALLPGRQPGPRRAAGSVAVAGRRDAGRRAGRRAHVAVPHRDLRTDEAALAVHTRVNACDARGVSTVGTRGRVRMRTLKIALFAMLLALAACGDDTTTSGGTTTGGGGDDATTATEAGGDDSTTTVEGIDPLTDADTDAKSGESTVDNTGLLTDVRIARHEGYDRIVFEFRGDGLPGWNVEYVDPPIIEDASGDVVEIEGDAFIQVRMFPASGFDMEAVVESYTGPDQLDGADFGMSVVQEVERTGDFEAVLNWTIGLSDEVDFRVLTLSGPGRLVIDVRNH